MQKIFIVLALAFSPPIVLIAQQNNLTGFPAAKASGEHALETTFDGLFQPADLDQWMKKLSSHPHHLGSPYGKINAEYLRGLFSDWGFDAHIETYKVLFPTPTVRVLELTDGSRFKAKLAEPALKEDATSGQVSEQLPVYNAWSADGDVNATLVYVNYGVPDDYETLERLGIDVKGKIVIARYGGSWRGIKPKVAQEHGAVGCIIYSDPKDDGYTQGDVYPKGPFRNQYGAQRGSVLDMPVYPGDPLTPGKGATENAVRLDRKDATTILKIPVLPISYSDALPLLNTLSGPVAPEKWRGSLGITYHVGPGTVNVHMMLAFDWKMVDCYNVIARLTGSELPDEWVIRGNHHDAWVNGANDPISGLVAELSEAKALGALVKSGWKPRRTIIYCAWDGEEPGLIGSTEWAEDHAVELQQKTVAYINSDDNGRGFLFVGGSHTLETLMSEVGRDVIDPQTGVSVMERKKSFDAAGAPSIKSKKEILNQKTLTIDALGSGSDFSAFLQHLGIATLNIGYAGENDGGEYHSVYDSYDLYKKFKDPDFQYGIALAKTTGRTVLRLSDAQVLPFNFTKFQQTVSAYLAEVSTLLETMRETTAVENQMIHENRYVQSADPTKKYVPSASKDAVPFLDFSNLQNAMTALEVGADKFAGMSNSSPAPGVNINHLNKILYQAEQKLLSPTGLPRRNWYKHAIYAPGFYTGYGVKTLPGIREAIEQRAWNEAQEQIDIVASVINDYTENINAAVKVLMMR